MAYNFNGKKILVTGAGRNIGRGIATCLAKLEAKVYALDCVKENLDSLAQEVSGICPIYQDLLDWEETVKTVEKLEDLDGLVNCAGIITATLKAINTPRENLEKCINVNLLAAVNLMQVVGKKMIAAGKGGSIVNISSQGSMFAHDGLLPYCISKAGLDMATKMFALELGPHKIRVNSINPGMVETELAKTVMSPEGIQHIASLSPLRRLAGIQDVADLVSFYLSDSSVMINGTNNLINGGFTCYLPFPISDSKADAK